METLGKKDMHQVRKYPGKPFRYRTEEFDFVVPDDCKEVCFELIGDGEETKGKVYRKNHRGELIGDVLEFPVKITLAIRESYKNHLNKR